VQFRTSEAVEKLETFNGRVRHIHTASRSMPADAVIGSADYRHIERALLSPPDRHYPDSYWAERTFAPSCLLFYLGISKRITRLRHHNLFFDQDFGLHAEEIYQRKTWPTAPLFYVCCPSVTDPSVAPEGHENLFILMPIATNLPDPEPIREHYYQLLMDRLEKFAGETIRDHVVLKRSYCVSDFKNDYNACQGNAYGLANTLRQTAVLKPKLKSPKVHNLFFAGQLTVPGPGVPPAIISGTIAAHEVLKYLNS
jgi:phytoene desaturase